MKPYGNTRRDNLTCKWGCCGFRGLLGYRRRRVWCGCGAAKRVLRRGRSKARQQGARACHVDAE